MPPIIPSGWKERSSFLCISRHSTCPMTKYLTLLTKTKEGGEEEGEKNCRKGRGGRGGKRTIDTLDVIGNAFIPASFENERNDELPIHLLSRYCFVEFFLKIVWLLISLSLLQSWSAYLPLTQKMVD